MNLFIFETSPLPIASTTEAPEPAQFRRSVRSNLQAAQQKAFSLFASLLELLDPVCLLFGSGIVGLLIQHQQVEVGPVMVGRNLEGSRQGGFCQGEFFTPNVNQGEFGVWLRGRRV